MVLQLNHRLTRIHCPVYRHTELRVCKVELSFEFYSSSFESKNSSFEYCSSNFESKKSIRVIINIALG
jgi:hypothetical protein